MFALIAAATLVAGTPATGPEPARVLVTLNGGDYQPGDQVRVEVEPEDDGYLIVFRVDGDGYLRVLFPLDPDLDAFVRGGGRYELRGRGERESFLADDRGGTGMVFAALSREPLAFDQYADGTHWDYERLWLPDPAGDVEAQLLAIVRVMADNGRFDHDAVGYRVWGPGYQAEPITVVAGGAAIPTIDPYGYYDPTFDCLACGWGMRSGINISIGSRWNPWGLRTNWYDPWDRYNYWNYGYGYGYNPYNTVGGWNGWWGWDSYHGTPYRPYTVINTPPRPVVVDSRTGLRSRPRQPVVAGVGGQPRIGTTVAGTSGRPTAGTRPTPDTETRGRARDGSGASIPRRTEALPSSGSAAPASAPRTTSSAPSRSSTGTSTRSRGRPGDEAAAALPSIDRRSEQVTERPVYRPPTRTTSPDLRRPVRELPSARPSSSPPPGSVDSRTRSVSRPVDAPTRATQPRSVSVPRSSSIPSRTSSAPPRSSGAMPRSSAPPRSASIPQRSSSPAMPRTTSSAPSRSSSMPRASSMPSRASSSPSRSSSTPSRSASPASSGKSSAPARSRGGSDS